jgi:hypothetical protein
MPTIFIGLLALALVLWLAKSFARADPKYMIRVGRQRTVIVAPDVGFAQMKAMAIFQGTNWRVLSEDLSEGDPITMNGVQANANHHGRRA